MKPDPYGFRGDFWINLAYALFIIGLLVFLLKPGCNA